MIYTESVFYFNYSVKNGENSLVIIKPDTSEITLTLEVGNYSQSSVIEHVNSLLISIGETVQVVADDEKIKLSDVSYTISNSSTYSLLKGLAYFPPFMLQSFQHRDNNEELRDSKLNISASGKQELIYFGSDRKFNFEIKYEGKSFECLGGSPEGLAMLRLMLESSIRGEIITFYPDYKSEEKFDLIWTGSAKYRLRELYNRGLPDCYETGLLSYREVTSDC